MARIQVTITLFYVNNLRPILL